MLNMYKVNYVNVDGNKCEFTMDNANSYKYLHEVICNASNTIKSISKLVRGTWIVVEDNN